MVQSTRVLPVSESETFMVWCSTEVNDEADDDEASDQGDWKEREKIRYTWKSC